MVEDLRKVGIQRWWMVVRYRQSGKEVLRKPRIIAGRSAAAAAAVNDDEDDHDHDDKIINNFTSNFVVTWHEREVSTTLLHSSLTFSS